MAPIPLRRRLRAVNPNIIGWAAVGTLVGYAVGQVGVAVVIWMEDRETRKRMRSLGVPG